MKYTQSPQSSVDHKPWGDTHRTLIPYEFIRQLSAKIRSICVVVTSVHLPCRITLHTTITDGLRDVNDDAITASPSLGGVYLFRANSKSQQKDINYKSRTTSQQVDIKLLTKTAVHQNVTIGHISLHNRIQIQSIDLSTLTIGTIYVVAR